MLPPAPHCSFRVFAMDPCRAELWLLYAFNPLPALCPGQAGRTSLLSPESLLLLSNRCQGQAEHSSRAEEFPAAQTAPVLLTYHDLSPYFASMVRGKTVRIKQVHP